MKKILSLPVLILLSFMAHAQFDSSGIDFKKFRQLPKFKVAVVPDSTIYTFQDLEKDKPFIIMIFGADCGHCKYETKKMMAYKEELKGIQILMASPVSSYNEIKAFRNEYRLDSMPNVKLARDENFTLGNVFQTRIFPSMYLYDSQGNFVKPFSGNIEIPDVLAALKKK